MSARTLINDGFDQPQAVDDIAMAFGGDMSKLLPRISVIPEDFKGWHGTDETKRWIDFTSKWFFKGANVSDLTPRRDVDSELALRHLKAILASWEPKHEHKEAAVAWLLSRWFEAVTV